ncbi:MAG: phage tail sheath C-terminal domain-containing protein [Betaproteobacteria bacterium]
MATSYLAPGVYIEEISTGARPIEAVGTSTAAFIGEAPTADAYLGKAEAVNNWTEFVTKYAQDPAETTNLAHAVYGFFLNGGGRCYVVNVGKAGIRTGLRALEAVDEVAIVAAPGQSDPDSYDALIGHCESLKDRIAILDAPLEVTKISALKDVAIVTTTGKGKGKPADADAAGASAPDGAGLRPRESENGYGAFYFPWLIVRDPLNAKATDPVSVPPSGHLAGIYARTDAMRGVHKAPANEPVRGALGLTYRVTHQEQEVLNPNGVNCIRFFAGEGIKVWGARTIAPSSSEWRYINVRRLFMMIEESIGRSTRWVVFEPNDISLWKKIRRDVSAFLRLLWSQGALMGATPDEAFFVKCDAETNPPEVIDAGRVVVLIGIAPVKPAEFVIFRIGQGIGGTEVEVQG